MRLRRYADRAGAKTTQLPEDDHKRRHRPEDTASSSIPTPDYIEAGQHSTTRALRQQVILQMQQSHGNAAVRRYLADRGLLPATTIQRAPADDWGSGQGQAKSETKDKSLPTYVALASIVGEKQGAFKGNSHIPGHEGLIEGSEFDIRMSVSKTPDSTDKGSKVEVQFRTELDDHSNQFITALANNETLKTATFELLHSDSADGKLKSQRTFRFSGGRITRVEAVSPPSDDPHGQDKPSYMAIDMQFQKMSSGN